MSLEFNRRVLVVDDEAVIRETIVEILAPPRETHSLEAAAARAFGEVPATAPRRSSATFCFEVETAPNGESGVHLTQAALDAEAPYALAFLDIRMPGLNGFETAQRLRDLDPRLEIVFMTAYSDVALDDIVARLGEGIAYHCKPFGADEIKQIATKGVHDWNRLRSLEETVSLVAGLRASARDEHELLQEILERACSLSGSATGALLTRQGLTWRGALAKGALQEPAALAELVNLLTPAERALGASLLPLGDYRVTELEDHVLAVGLAPTRQRPSLLELFLPHARSSLEALRLRARETRNQRLSALGLAMSSVVHDLRQPITAMTGAVELIELTQTAGAPSDEFFEVLSRAVADLRRYVSKLAELTRPPSRSRERLDLRELLQEVSLRTNASPRLALVEIEDLSEPLHVLGNGHDLQRALLNLIENAADAAQTSPHPCVQVSIQPRRGFASIEVRDNGPGIPSQVRSSLFEPFATYGKQGGTGLGLAIVLQIAESCGGTISVLESTPAGSTFQLRLPLSADE